MVDEALIIDSRIRVWWTASKRWYAGRVVAVGRGDSGSVHTIAYDDGAQATHYLQSASHSLNETWETEPSPGRKFPAKTGATMGGQQPVARTAAGTTLARGPAKGARKKRAATSEQTDAAEAAVRQAEAEGLTLQPSSNASGYMRVTTVVGQTSTRYSAKEKRAGKEVYLGCFDTAEEAALAVARAAARTTTAPVAAPRAAAAKRAVLPPAKQPRSTLVPRPVVVVDSVLAPPSAPALVATVAAAPAPAIFKDKLALLKRELDIKPAIPAIPAIAKANELLGITPSSGDSLGAQLDKALAAISR